MTVQMFLLFVPALRGGAAQPQPEFWPIGYAFSRMRHSTVEECENIAQQHPLLQKFNNTLDLFLVLTLRFLQFSQHLLRIGQALLCLWRVAAAGELRNEALVLAHDFL